MPRKRKAAPSEVFISHSSKNSIFIDRLSEVLAKHGVKSFVSKANIRGAQEWHDEIGTALKRCDWFLLVLSPQSVRSAWVKHELIYALQENRYRGHIIPVLYKNCDKEALSWTLSAIEWIDFRRDFDEACEKLMSIWQLKYRPIGVR
jgi:TIR domain